MCDAKRAQPALEEELGCLLEMGEVGDEELRAIVAEGDRYVALSPFVGSLPWPIRAANVVRAHSGMPLICSKKRGGLIYVSTINEERKNDE